MRRLLLLANVLSLVAAASSVARADETLLILHKWSESLGAYDADTGRRRGASLGVGRVPHEMVMTPDGRQLYVTNYGVRTYTDTGPGGNTISIVDLGHRRKAGEIRLPDHRRPHGIALGRSGRLYVTTDAPPAVVVLDPDARKVVAAYPVDAQLPHMLAVRADEGAIYVANAGSASVSVIHPPAKPGAAPRTSSVAVGGVPMGLALSPDEARLYVTNRQGNALVVVDTLRESVVEAVPLAGAPARVAPLPGGRQLAVTLIEAGDVALVDARTFAVVRRVHVGGRAEGLFVDPRGRFVCVSAQEENKVVKLALPSLDRLLDIPTDQRPDPAVLVPAKFSFR
jgi:YVTN family beta-propeller protein